MACNCASQEQLNELYRRYGEKMDIKASESVKFRIKNTLIRIGVAICLIPIIPVIFLYVLYKAFGDDNHQISVKKFFKIKEKNIATNVG